MSGGIVQIPLRVMFFIDAGFFTRWVVKNGITREEYNFSGFVEVISNNAFNVLVQPRVIRTYYYDGMPDINHQKECLKQKEFHDYLNRTFKNFEVKVGSLIKPNTNWIQKGVDVLIANDMLEKALRDQYDVAILVSGDQDHLPTVKTVKNTGKQVFGVYEVASGSKDLINEFDIGYELEPKDAQYKVTNKHTFQYANVPLPL